MYEYFISYRVICVLGLLLATAAGYRYKLSFTCDFYIFATLTVTSNIMMCFLQTCKVRHKDEVILSFTPQNTSNIKIQPADNPGTRLQHTQYSPRNFEQLIFSECPTV